MKKDVNLILLFILVVMGASMIGAAIYYQKTFDNLRLKYEESKSQIDKKSQDLNEMIRLLNEREEELKKAEQELLDYINELNLSQSRVLSLGSHFTTLKSEKEELELTLNKTINERDQWLAAYTSTKNELDITKQSLKIKIEQLNEANKKIEKFRADAILIKNDLDNITARVKNINNSRNSLKQTMSGLKEIIDGLEEGEVKDKGNSLIRDMSDQVADDGYIKSWTDSIETFINSIRKRLEGMK